MKANPWLVFVAGIAIASGGVVLLGYFLQLPLLGDLRSLLLDWSVILAAVALLIGVANLARVHWGKIRSRDRGAVYSAVTLAALAMTAAVGLFGGSTSPWSLWIFNHVLVPVETSLMALLAVTLILAITRLFARQLSLPSLVFIAVALFILVASFGLAEFEILGVNALRRWITDTWALAGARGILLGVALGAIATGIRVLIGVDRPYGR